MRKGGGFGAVVLVVVTAAVLLLVARAWKQAAPTAVELERLDGSAALDAHGEADAAGEVRTGELPRLPDMQRNTDTHAAQVVSALSSTD